MPAGGIAQDRTARKILIHGHRGARAVLPENTIPAFEYAIAQGADAIELDVAVTKDNAVVVSHDPELHPPICSGPRPPAAIRDLTLAEVREWDCGKTPNPKFPKQRPVPGTRMPTLDEALALAPGNRVQFDIEIKSFPDRPELTPPPDEFARLVLDLVRKHRLEKRVVVQSFDFRALHSMKNLAPDIRRSALWEGEDRDFISIAHEADARIVSPEFHLVTLEKVRESHDSGLQIVPWTANESTDWDRLIAARVDGIITDDPAALIAYLKR